MSRRERISLREALQQALRMEETSKSFYYKLAQRLEDLEEKKALNRLISQKEGICNFLKREYRQQPIKEKEGECGEINDYGKQMFHIGP